MYTVYCILYICTLFLVVWFEPTDRHHVRKLFMSDAWKHVTYTSPNLSELEQLVVHTRQMPDCRQTPIQRETGMSGYRQMSFKLRRFVVISTYDTMGNRWIDFRNWAGAHTTDNWCIGISVDAETSGSHRYIMPIYLETGQTADVR